MGFFPMQSFGNCLRLPDNSFNLRGYENIFFKFNFSCALWLQSLKVPAQGQILNRVKERVTQKIDDEKTKAEEATDRALDKTEEAVKKDKKQQDGREEEADNMNLKRKRVKQTQKALWLYRKRPIFPNTLQSFKNYDF